MREEHHSSLSLELKLESLVTATPIQMLPQFWQSPAATKATVVQMMVHHTCQGTDTVASRKRKRKKTSTEDYVSDTLLYEALQVNVQDSTNIRYDTGRKPRQKSDTH